MQEIIDYREWVNHPYLRKLVSRSDYDGDAAFTVRNPTEADFSDSISVSLEFRINEGEWTKAPFAERAVFIDQVSVAWYYPFNYHPLFELDPERKGKQVPHWRAIVTK